MLTVPLQKMCHVYSLGLAWQYWLVSVCQTLSKLNLRLGSIVSEAILKKGTDIQQTDNHSASKCQSCVNISWKPPWLLKWASQGECKHICQSSQTNTPAARRKFWEVKINVIWKRNIGGDKILLLTNFASPIVQITVYWLYWICTNM